MWTLHSFLPQSKTADVWSPEELHLTLCESVNTCLSCVSLSWFCDGQGTCPGSRSLVLGAHSCWLLVDAFRL